jgi:[ribosomal protein S5]-alanine N-acetyltransferase
MNLATPITEGTVTLAALAPRHADGPYLRWFDDPEVTRFLVPLDGAMTAERLRRYIADNAASDASLLAGIFTNGSTRHVGNIRLTSIDRRLSRASVGILIGDRGEWGRGCASAAIAALTRYAHGILSIENLYAGCHHENRGSVNAFRNAGWVDFTTVPTDIRARPALAEGTGIEHVMMVHCRDRAHAAGRTL